jgi:hypothetical protein
LQVIKYAFLGNALQFLGVRLPVRVEPGVKILYIIADLLAGGSIINAGEIQQVTPVGFSSILQGGLS